MSRSSAATAHETDALLREVVRLFQQAQRTMTACCTEATTKECQALLLLGSAGDPLNQQEFAQRMGLEKTWTSRLIARLEQRGLVRRSKHPEDGRIWLIGLTPKGRKEHGLLEASLNTQAVNLLGCVPAAERANVERALRHLRDALATCLTACGPGGKSSC
ncbi:MAG: MarR family transcriptional regulator [Opitutaceae bacterium]|nr:MarR family transcriptional regulator [Opitutaceae bacterium]